MQKIYMSCIGRFGTSIKLMLLLVVMGIGGRGWGQVTIVSDGLNNTSTLFSLSGGTYYTGNSAASGTDVPFLSPFASEGTHSRGVSNGTATLTSSADINTSGYTSIFMSLRVASFSISTTGNGADVGDIITVEVSPDGGTTWYSTVRVLGNGNATWAYSTGTGNASTAYDGNVTPVDFAPAGGGARTTDGYSTITVTGLPSITNLRIRITLFNSATLNERWVVDDFKIQGTTACTSPSTQASALTFSSVTPTSQTLNFTRGDGDAGVLIIGKAGSASTDPASGTAYAGANLAFGAGTAVGSGFALYYGAAAGASTATSQNVTSLTAETRYYYNFYEYNTASICYNLTELAGDAWTLSTLPTGHAGSFTNSVIAYNQIDLAYSLPSIVAADGYVILRRSDGVPPTTTGIVNGVTPATWTLPAGTTIINANATGIAYSNTGLTASTNYCYLLVPFNWNGTNSETYNYRVAATVPTTCGNTPAFPDPAIVINSSSVVAGNINIGSTNNIIYSFSTAVTLSDATFTGVTLPTSYTSSSDFSALGFKIWYNTTNTFSGATQLGAGVNPTGSNIIFSSLSQSITAATTGYFFITVDVSPSAVATNTIIGNSLPIANVSFIGTVTKSGSPSAAGLKTIVMLSYAAFDNFDRTNNTTVGIPSSGGLVSWSENETGTSCSPANSIIRLKNNLLEISNCSDGLTTSCGTPNKKFVSFDVSSKYSTTFDFSNSSMEWYFNMKESRPSPSGFNSGNYGTAFILGANEADFSTSTVDGYAVIIGSGGVPTLVSFTNGIANSTLSNIVIGPTFTNKNNYLSFKVTFDPCTKLWSLNVRDDGSTAFSNPTTLTGLGSTSTDNTLTSTPLNFLGAYRNHSSSCEEIARFDNFFIPSGVASINTYTWNGTTTDYQVATNWTPARNCPKVNDILVFDASSPASSNVTNVPTQTIGKLLISGNTTVNFKDVAADVAISFLTIGGGTGTDFQVDAGSSFIFDVASSNSPSDAVILTLSTGASSLISGTVIFRNSNSGTAGRLHQLYGTDASSIIVANGGIIRAEDLNGDPFGTTGNSNVIVFQAGARYESIDGSSPFGLTQPSSRVVFNNGSLYKHAQSSVPSFSGRTYANFEYDFAGTTNFLFGGNGAVRMDSLIVTHGIFNITGASGSLPINMIIKKDLFVASGSTFNYSPSNSTVASSISFAGTSNIQKLNNQGTLTFGRFATFELNNTNSIPRLDIETNIRIQGTLKVTAGNLNLSTGDITMQSDATSTANVSSVNGAITYGTGRFNIERYLFAQKSWRLLSTPVLKLADDAGSPTINDSWREGGTSLASTSYGTRVTGPGPIGTPSGVDEYSIRGSMKSYNMIGNNYVEITSADLAANKTIANDEGYYVFVRGDRAIDGPSGVTGSTTLRMKGRIRTGDQTFNVNTNAFQSVGNPFPSRLQFSSITKFGGTEDAFIIWNPSNLSGGYGVGRFEQYANVSGNYIGAFGTRNFIESGEAFFISSTAGAGSITIKETDKTNGSANVSRAGVTFPTLEINLLAKATDNTNYKADGTSLNFDPSYVNTITNDDVKKFNNASDNIYILKNNTKLFVERRKPLTINDTIFLALTNTRVASYSLEIDPSVLGNLPLTAFLVDKFLATETPVSLTAVTNVPFSITADAASKVADRFKIVFKQAEAAPILLVITITAVANADKTNTVKWTVNNQTNLAGYSVERSANGLAFDAISNTAVRVNTAYSFNDAAPLTAVNYYRVKANETNGQIRYSDVVKVSSILSLPTVKVQPNPVLNKTLHINFENMVGAFSLRLTNKQGATVFSKQLNIASINEVKNIELGDAVAAGVYDLLIVDSKGKQLVQTIFIQ